MRDTMRLTALLQKEIYTAETHENGIVVKQYTCKQERYGSVLSRRTTSASSFYHYDGQGSTRKLTDSNQSVEASYTYSAFGETVAESGGMELDFSFNGANGYFTDSHLGDMYVRRRYYLPNLGRWLSQDPVLFKDSSNLYGYARNSGMSRLLLKLPVVSQV